MSIETLLLQAKRLLEEARIAAEGCDVLLAYELMGLALQVVGAALDRCAGLVEIRGDLP